MSNFNDRLPIDYVTKDYEGFLEMMKDNIPNLTPEWTDTSDSDQGMVILQLLSYGLHILGYYQDKAVNENFLSLAQTKKAILLLCNFLGYELSKQKPAKSVVTFYKDDTKFDETVIVSMGTQVSTNPEFGEQVIYETDEPLVIPAGEESGEVPVTQGETVTREFVGIGTGLDIQKFLLEHPDVITESLEVVTEENGRDYYWDLVDSTLDSTPSDRHFTISMDEEDRTIIIFGDGIFGMRPPQDDNVFANYRYGGGTIGNLAVGLINTIVDSLVTGIDEVKNEVIAEGGTDYEDLERARVSAPKFYRTGSRAITPQDFEDLAELQDGVLRAECEETFNENNEAILYIATTNQEPASDIFLENIKSIIDEVRVMNVDLLVKNCEYVEIGLEIDLYVFNNFMAEEVKMNVENAIRDYFQTSNFELGDEIYMSRIMSSSLAVDGVRNVSIKIPTDDIICEYNEFPKLTEVNITTVGGIEDVQ